MSLPPTATTTRLLSTAQFPAFPSVLSFVCSKDGLSSPRPLVRCAQVRIMLPSCFNLPLRPAALWYEKKKVFLFSSFYFYGMLLFGYIRCVAFIHVLLSSSGVCPRICVNTRTGSLFFWQIGIVPPFSPSPSPISPLFPMMLSVPCFFYDTPTPRAVATARPPRARGSKRYYYYLTFLRVLGEVGPHHFFPNPEHATFPS